LFLDNVVQIGSDFQAEIPDCISGTVLQFLFDYYPGSQLLMFIQTCRNLMLLYVTSLPLYYTEDMVCYCAMIWMICNMVVKLLPVANVVDYF